MKENNSQFESKFHWRVGTWDKSGQQLWDQLLAQSKAQTVFLTSDWIESWRITLGKSCSLIFPQIWASDQLIGGAIFFQDGTKLRFAAYDRSDYADFVIHKTVSEKKLNEFISRLVHMAYMAAPKCRSIQLRHIPSASPSLQSLQDARDCYSYVTHTSPAPTMDMENAENALRKKSLRRHEKGLNKLGYVDFQTHCTYENILPGLDGFFDLHVRRWQNTGYPSLFNNEKNRDFYRELARRADNSRYLRYSELKLDGQLLAAHFGFVKFGKFIWYKPAYDPAMAKYSPGEVLIKNLIELAIHESVAEFDFTIGDEKFKHRFATRVPTVSDVYITQGKLNYVLKYASHKTRNMTKGLITRVAEKYNRGVR